MKSHISSTLVGFRDGCRRASQLKVIHDHLRNTAPLALDCGDILRSALVLAVSSFDLFLHDLYRLEVLYRLDGRKEISSLRIPFNILVSDSLTKHEMVDAYVRRENSYKSFVAPDKLAECLRVFVESPWDRIAEKLGENPTVAKTKLKAVVDLRNRIAHEADVNPDYGGIGLWPIYSDDVAGSISFVTKLGDAIAAALDEA